MRLDRDAGQAIAGALRRALCLGRGERRDLLGRAADWLYFMTWTTDWIIDSKLNPPEFLNRAYNSARFITRDEVPNLKDA